MYVWNDHGRLERNISALETYLQHGRLLNFDPTPFDKPLPPPSMTDDSDFTISVVALLVAFLIGIATNGIVLVVLGFIPFVGLIMTAYTYSGSGSAHERLKQRLAYHDALYARAKAKSAEIAARERANIPEYKPDPRVDEILKQRARVAAIAPRYEKFEQQRLADLANIKWAQVFLSDTWAQHLHARRFAATPSPKATGFAERFSAALQNSEPYRQADAAARLRIRAAFRHVVGLDEQLELIRDLFPPPQPCLPAPPLSDLDILKGAYGDTQSMRDALSEALKRHDLPYGTLLLNKSDLGANERHLTAL